jgi:hypothetical protein
MPKKWLTWAIIILLAAWIFHIHFNRGVPVKRGGGK